MTLNLKIKHDGPSVYAARVLRHGTEVGKVEKPGEEVSVAIWNDAPLTIEEYELPKKAE